MLAELQRESLPLLLLLRDSVQRLILCYQPQEAEIFLRAFNRSPFWIRYIRLFGTLIRSRWSGSSYGCFVDSRYQCYVSWPLLGGPLAIFVSWCVHWCELGSRYRLFPEHRKRPIFSCYCWGFGADFCDNLDSVRQSGQSFSLVKHAFALTRPFDTIQPTRGHASAMVTLATILEVGGIAASLVLKTMLSFVMDVARGYPYYSSSDEVEIGFGLTLPKNLVFGFIWIGGSVLVAATIVYRDGNFRRLNLVSMVRQGYTLVPSTDNGDRSRHIKTSPAPWHRDAPPPPDAYNMFDPADLPPRLAEYANMVYSACEDLGNFFGFQDSSVRNQAEHILILLSNNRRYMSSHILPPSVQPPSPIHALHAKVFSNYVKWCRAMGVPPHFSKMNASMSAPPAVASRVVDLVLYFCIWGEGCNLRHMPECTWFLYHKMMEEYVKSEGFTQTRSLYAGHFLDHVVEPIFSIVSEVRTRQGPTGE